MSELDLALGALAVAVALGTGALWSWIRSAPQADRQWHDRPPRWWRWHWALVRPIAHALRNALPETVETKVHLGLKRAGLGFALTPQEFCAGALLASGLGCAIGGAAAGVVGDAIDAALAGASIGAALGCGWAVSWLMEASAHRVRVVERSLPFYLDLVTLMVESGANLTGALAQAVDRGPPGPLRDELSRVLGDLRAGRTRADALRAMSDRIVSSAVSSWVTAMVAADRNGSGLGQVLRAQAEQRRQERFQRAEKLAMQAPVKMLFPLLAFIFPCTFVLLFFPIVVRLLQEGMLS